MKEFSFIHTGDLHLDSPFKGISDISSEISSQLKEATFNAYNRIIDLCIARQVDFLLISGDIYDGVDRSLGAQLRFREGTKRLSKAQINAYIVHGNHDSLNGWSANLEWPENVHIFGGKSVGEILVEKEGEKIAKIYGISFPKRDIKTNLTKKFPNIPESERDLFHIGMLHCNVGSNSDHDPYAPCNLSDLVNKNFDYWALGHVHTKSVLNNDPLVIYPGNTQGLHPKETGPRGCYLVNVDKNGEATYEFIEVDSIRWFVEELPIDSLSIEQELISEIDDLVELIREKAGGRPVVCRIHLTGRGDLHAILAKKGFLEDILQETRESQVTEKEFVWIESFVDTTNSKIDRNALLEHEDFIGDLVKLFEEAHRNPKLKNELKESLDPLFRSSTGRKFLDAVTDEDLQNLLKKAESLCLDKLMGI